jgi:hypothetical protein
MALKASNFIVLVCDSCLYYGGTFLREQKAATKKKEVDKV